LKSIWKKYDGSTWTGFVCLQAWTSGRLLWTFSWNLLFYNVWTVVTSQVTIILGLRCFGMWRCVVGQVDSDILKEHNTYILRVKKPSFNAWSLKLKALSSLKCEEPFVQWYSVISQKIQILNNTMWELQMSQLVLLKWAIDPWSFNCMGSSV
jgi:hypothetical protein